MMAANKDAQIIKRIRYYVGQRLTANDFEDQQAYHNDKMAHLLKRYPYGIIDGLDVVKENENGIAGFRILEGLAVDKDGREIRVQKNGIFVVEDGYTEDKPYLSLKYKEEYIYEGSPVCTASKEHNRILETAEVVWVDTPNMVLIDTEEPIITVAFIKEDQGNLTSEYDDGTSQEVRKEARVLDESDVLFTNEGHDHTESGNGNKIPEAGIEDKAVTTAKIDDKAVTAAKIDDKAVTSAKIDDKAVTSAKIDDKAVTSAKIDDKAVTAAKIDDKAVTAAKIDDKAVTTAKIDDKAITAAKIDDKAVTTAKIDDKAVTAAKIDDKAVTAAKIDDKAVTAAKIDDNAVTEAKINNGAVTNDKILLKQTSIVGSIAAWAFPPIAIRTLTLDYKKHHIINVVPTNNNRSLSWSMLIEKISNNQINYTITIMKRGVLFPLFELDYSINIIEINKENI
jgi:hypothetical protein